MIGEALAQSRASRGLPIVDALPVLGRWMMGAAVFLTMTTPKIAFGGVHVTVGDLLGAVAGVCWLTAWALAPSRAMNLRGALWPAVVLGVAAASAASSLNVQAAGLGLAELAVLWVLPSLAIPNLISTPMRVTRFLLCMSVASVIAGSANLVRAAEIGIAGGLPQVWGPVEYFQGYFQAIGLTIAVSRLVQAVASRRVSTTLAWFLACCVNASALLLTQTRGAWLAAVVALIVLGMVWRPSVLIGTIGVLSVAVVVLWGAGWAAPIRERVLSIFTLEAGLSGFESSLGRLGLVDTAWRMFTAHPLFGVGLKNFAIAMPMYVPPGMPFAYEMGTDQVLTSVEGPHSTYLSLLSEVGVLGLLALLCWEVGAVRRLYRESRSARSVDGPSQTNAAVLLAGVTVVIVYNLFFEMGQTGVLVLVSLLALGYRTPPPHVPA